MTASTARQIALENIKERILETSPERKEQYEEIISEISELASEGRLSMNTTDELSDGVKEVLRAQGYHVNVVTHLRYSRDNMKMTTISWEAR